MSPKLNNIGAAEMFRKIKKRNGEIIAFDASRITTAIRKAGEATGEFDGNEAAWLTKRALIHTGKSGIGPIPEVEEIQDMVEKTLFESQYSRTAKAYIIYRDQHARIRDILEKANSDLVEGYLQKLDWKINENSNMTYSLQGLNNQISSHVSSEYWLNRIYPPEIREAHKSGDFHIHDLNLLSVYCVGWDLQDLLRQGFRGASSKVESGPARHFRPALGQLVNFFYTLQGEAAGAQAVSNFDTLLAPFVRYDQLSYEEVKQALQEFLFNINIPTRVGFQTPFTNITMDLEPPGTLKHQPVIIGGVEQKEKYSDFQIEMDMINQAFAEVMMEGDARGRVFTFPIPTYNITKNFDWDNPALEPVLKMTGKYGIPYFSNFVNSDMSPEDVKSICCRLRLNNRELLKTGGGLFGASPLTGSIGVVTINLPRIGYQAKNEDDFFGQLQNLVILAADSLSLKKKVIENFSEKGLYPYSEYYLRHVKEGKGRYWANHFSTIGIIGMNEACLNLFGRDIGTDKGQVFALKTMDYLRSILSDLQEKSSEMFNLEATPGEGTSYRLAMLDKKRFPNIICANESAYQKGEAPFYNNSTQLPVNHTDDLFEALMLQDDLQTKYTGGTVFHVYLGERFNDTDALKSLIQKIVTRFRLPYFTITPTFSVCPSHGYLNGEQPECPVCGIPTEVYSRVVGYMRPVRQWNRGKQAEFKLRTAFSI
jgi:anaerobic ribonucleoside-triphosphate reductase